MRIILISFLLVTVINASAQTSFPAECNDELQLRSAWPKHPDTLRFWVKGSTNYRDITVEDATGLALVKPFRVEPPYYTHVFEFPRVLGEMVITATGGGAPLVERLELTADLQRLPNPGEAFSILAYGCLEPFEVKKKKASSFVDFDNNMPGASMLLAFRAVALGEPLHQHIIERREAGQWGDCIAFHGPFITPPSVVIGTGDQVYVDAGYETKPCKFNDKQHPLSAWQVKRRPYPLDHMRDTMVYMEHLDRMYRSFHGFEHLQDVLERVPQANVLDDHEIRDGWGSQQDEYTADGRMNPDLAPHFRASASAFSAHQSIGGPPFGAVSSPSVLGAPLYRSFDVGPVKCFSFDLRSYRNSRKGIVLGNEQWAYYRAWMARLEPKDTILLISSIPIFFFTKPVSQVSSWFKWEMADDLRDGWRHPCNREEHETLVASIVELRERGVTILVLSGDVHMGAISEVWYNSYVGGNMHRIKDFAEKRLLATELTTTGLFHAHLQTETNASLQKWAEASRTGRSGFSVPALGKNYFIDGQYRWSVVRQNYGAFEFGPQGIFADIVLGIGDTSQYSVQDMSPNCEDRFQVARFKVDHSRTWAEEERFQFRSDAIIKKQFWPWKRFIAPAPPDEIRWFSLRRP